MHKKLRSLIAIVSLLMLTLVMLPSVAFADTMTFTATKDTHIKQIAPNSSAGGTANPITSDGNSDGAGSDQFALVGFDLSSLPSNATVTDADVEINVSNSSVDNHFAREVLRNWNESATWNATGTGTNWATAGANNTTSDIASTAFGTITANVSGYETFNVPLTTFSNWKNGTSHGFLVRSPSSNDDMKFTSREGSVGANRPKLVVQYTVADTTPPQTTIDSGPSGTVSSSSQNFSFSSNEAGSTFECSLDGAAYSSCTSPKSYTNLSYGSHTFNVKATDSSSNTDATPASRTFTVDVFDSDADGSPDDVDSEPTGGICNTGAGDIVIDRGDDIDATIDGTSRTGKKFCILSGEYNVNTSTTDGIIGQDQDQYLGISHPNQPQPRVYTTTEYNVFDLETDQSVTIDNLKIEGATAPNNWTDAKACQPSCGRGINQPGSDLTVTDSRITNNAAQGIGGAGTGLEIYRTEIDNNGYHQVFNSSTNQLEYVFFFQDDFESAAGMKSTSSFTIADSYIHHNPWTGVWCDIDCDTAIIQDNIIEHNGKTGIHIEISSATSTNPVDISGNTIQDNGDANYAWGNPNGVSIVNSSYVDVYNNILGNNNVHGVKVWWDKNRTNATSVLTDHINVYGNTLNGDTIDCSDDDDGANVSCQ